MKRDDVIFYRIEQLYPFPAKTLVKELKPYAKNANFIGVKRNKKYGSLVSVRDYIQWTLDNIKANNNKISYIGEIQIHHKQPDMQKDIFLNNRNYKKVFE